MGASGTDGCLLEPSMAGVVGVEAQGPRSGGY